MRSFHKVVLGCLIIGVSLAADGLWLPEQPTKTGLAADPPPQSVALNILWKKPVQPVSSISISPDATHVVTVGPDDLVTCRDPQGSVVWQVRIEHATHAVVSAGGRMTMVYSSMNPAEKQVTFVSPDGSIRWRREITGSAWCAAVAPETPTFAVGTGSGWVYIYSVDDDRRRYSRWKVEGTVASLSFFPDGEKLAYGTWQDSVVGVAQLDGTKLWHQPGDPDKLYFVRVAGAGKHVLAIGTPNRRLPAATASLYSADSSLLWTRAVDGTDLASDVSSLAYTSATSYRKLIKHKGKEAEARYLNLIDRSGGEKWEKGGIFFQPKLASFTRDGLLVYDDRAVYGLDLTGRVSSMIKLPARVRLCQSDPAGSRTIVYCGDGNLYCIGISTK